MNKWWTKGEWSLPVTVCILLFSFGVVFAGFGWPDQGNGIMPLAYVDHGYSGESSYIWVSLIQDGKRPDGDDDVSFVEVFGIEVSVRRDGHEYTSARFDGYIDRLSAYKRYERMTILVPTEEDVDIWLKFIQRCRENRQYYLDNVKLKPQRVLPVIPKSNH